VTNFHPVLVLYHSRKSPTLHYWFIMWYCKTAPCGLKDDSLNPFYWTIAKTQSI